MFKEEPPEEFKGRKFKDNGFQTDEFEEYLMNDEFGALVEVRYSALPKELLTEAVNWKGDYKGTAMTLVVLGLEGSIPHIHVYEGQRKKGIPVACVRLDKAEYFKHGDDQKFIDRFNSSYRKAFIGIIGGLIDPDNKDFLTVWEHLCYGWNAANPDHKMKKYGKADMPDYSKLE